MYGRRETEAFQETIVIVMVMSVPSLPFRSDPRLNTESFPGMGKDVHPRWPLPTRLEHTPIKRSPRQIYMTGSGLYHIFLT